MASITALNFSFGTGNILMLLVDKFVDFCFFRILCEKRKGCDQQDKEE